MRKILLGGTAAIALCTSTAFAGGMPEPTMTPDIIKQTTSSSAGGIVVPLLLLIVIAAAIAGNSSAVPNPASDARIKTDIQWLRMGPHGLPVYRFRYKGVSDVFEGVMAQDVANIRPDALIRYPNGLMAVNYNRLGIEMRHVA